MLRRGRFEQEGFLPVDVPGGAALGLLAAAGLELRLAERAIEHTYL
jgi:hypothetical protein